MFWVFYNFVQLSSFKKNFLQFKGEYFLKYGAIKKTVRNESHGLN